MNRLNEIEILYQDSDLAVVNKPTGLVVNRAKSVKGVTLQDWIDNKLDLDYEGGEISQESVDVFKKRSGLAHRIDKDTSGALVIAKNPSALTGLMDQFARRTVKKTYLALVHGVPSPDKGTITGPIDRNPFNRTKFGVFPGGKASETSYELVDRYLSPRGEEVGLVEVYPKTGRTHQIRVHFKYLNQPVIADPIYAGRKRSRRDRKWCPRLFLHAYRIVFSHPRTEKPIEVTASLAQDLRAVLDKLEKP